MVFAKPCHERPTEHPSTAPVRSTTGAIEFIRAGNRIEATPSKILDTLRRLTDDAREPANPLHPVSHPRVVAGLPVHPQAFASARVAHRERISRILREIACGPGEGTECRE